MAPPPVPPFDTNGEEDFPFNVETRIDYVGAKNFRSLQVTGDIRDRTRCAIAVTNDIGSPSADPRDLIEVGQVYRLQTFGELDGSDNIIAGGNIYADVTATMHSDKFQNGFRAGFDAVGYILAGQSVQGTIQATGAPDVFLHNSINKIIVGLNPIRTGGAVVGITGDIKAVRGRIRSILCNGPIGTTTRNSQILAGNGVLEVRCVVLDSFGNFFEAAPEDIWADIVANGDYTPGGDPSSDAPINYVQTDGQFVGSVHAGNIPAAAVSHVSGILVRGLVDAPIDIEFNLENASIIGASFLQPIRIGVKSKGTIVATDEIGGYIDSVTIGDNDQAPASYLNSYPRGMTGIDCPSTLIAPTLAEPFDAFGADDFLDPGVDPGSSFPCFDGSAAESMIRAHHVRAIWINQMSTQFADVASRKWRIPRIEADLIEDLTVLDLREGVIWSGNIEYPNGVLNNDPENDYATIDQLTIGDIGPWADVWFQDCPSADFTGDVYGELHVPSLASTELIRIGGGLLTYDACGCSFYDAETCPYPAPAGEPVAGENSPRSTDCAQPGGIFIAEEQGLHGQVIINANNGTPTIHDDGWEGLVHIGEGVTAIDLSPDSAPPYEAPYYTTTSATLGGGAVGLVPFQMHPFDSAPSYTPADAPGHEFVGTQWDNPAPFVAGENAIFIRHYGPVFGTASYVRVGLVTDQGEENFTNLFTVATRAQDSSLDPRTVRISYLHAKSDGKWVARPDGALSCDDTFLPRYPGLVPVGDWEYRFVMQLDCNNNGTPDIDEINPETNDLNDNGVIDSCEIECDCDLAGNPNTGGPNGIVDVFDLLAYLDLWFVADPGAERDGVSGVNVYDLLDYLDCWFYYSANGTCLPA